MHGSKAYLVTAFVVAFSVLIIVPVWFLLGVTKGSGHTHASMMVSVKAFRAKLDEQQQLYGLPDGSVSMPLNSKVYILAQQFAFTPHTIHLQRGGHYDLVFYSSDVLHGASLEQAGRGSVNTIVMPGMISTLSINTNQAGEIVLLCTEYCGAAHHLMRGKFIVE